MTSAVVLFLACLFGAGDQYLGSLEGHFGGYAWTSDVSLLSAPWLLLAFVAGWTSSNSRRAAVLGFAATLAALLGYLLMTLSPVENARLTAASLEGFVRSDPAVFLGSVVTGPSFGWLGYRWRVARAWPGAVCAAAVLCGEPLAHLVTGRAIRSSTVAWAEVAAGVLVATYFGHAWRRQHLRARVVKG